MIRDYEKHNFEYDGCQISILPSPRDNAVIITVDKGHFHRCYFLKETLERRLEVWIGGIVLSFERDNTEEKIEQFKKLVKEGRIELL